ncbi:hypothetical protein L6452_03494 [Arctium lappa]|uniref:Uncharacterized protein n=1 Tax=Arctium lappa TaxID=4217 RepID=A0ACB9FMI9_ARCLA|nr:hypothetical protein L6452_03494 [Arctium lappa]
MVASFQKCGDVLPIAFLPFTFSFKIFNRSLRKFAFSQPYIYQSSIQLSISSLHSKPTFCKSLFLSKSFSDIDFYSFKCYCCSEFGSVYSKLFFFTVCVTLKHEFGFLTVLYTIEINVQRRSIDRCNLDEIFLL